MNRKFIACCLLISLCVAPVKVSAGESARDRALAEITSGEIMDTIETLASPEFEGRLTGTDGYLRAARYAADRFAKWGLTSPSGGFFQEYPVTTGIIHQAALSITVPGEKEVQVEVECVLGKDFFPFGFSGNGTFTAPVVFAGYGMTVPAYGVDDYAGVDAKGKIVLMIKGAPDEREGEDWSEFDTHRFRTRNAFEHGAVGVLYVYRPMGNPNGDYLDGFPVLQLSESVAEQMLGNDLTVKTLKTLLNKRKNVSFETTATATLSVKGDRVDGSGYNVVAMIPGTDPGWAREAVVVGAHLDHCGAWPMFMPGADDNASGSAAVLAMARAASMAGVKAKRPIIFVLFGGEEMGLHGSRHFVDNLPAGITSVAFALNLDMVGAGEKTFILGLKKDKDFADLMMKLHDELGLASPLTGNERIGGYGSDHGPFIGKGWPAVSVFSSGGDHHGYHTPTDTPYWITPLISRDISRLVLAAAIEIANGKAITDP